MDLLMKTRAVKLKTHLGKFLEGDEDREKVRQSRNGSTRRAIWVVEPCPTNPDAIRIKNMSTSLYLTASDSPYLLGMTGKRVMQLSIFDPTRVEWEPIRVGSQLKFRSSKEGTYMRANGGTPPWRNSVTHDVPLTGGTYTWILWDVEPVLLSDLSSVSDASSLLSSFGSGLSDEVNGSYGSSPLSVGSTWATPDLSMKRSGMDLFRNAKTVRLKSHHDKYLTAHEDQDGVTQDRNGSARNAKWAVEFGPTGQPGSSTIRLISCYGNYLTASDQPFLLGLTGRKVLQTRPGNPGPLVEWEPIRDGAHVRLRDRCGNYLRANGGLPPWRNSVTIDVLRRTATQDWVVWEVDILEVSDNFVVDEVEKSGSGQVVNAESIQYSESFGSDTSSTGSERLTRQESNDYDVHLAPKRDGRLIYYHVADERGFVNEAADGSSFTFTGHTVAELSLKMEEVTGLNDIIVCTHSPLNGKLYPLRLQLPPNNSMLHIVVVPSTSKLAQEFL